MHGPQLTAWLLVALCAAVGGLCLVRTRGVCGAERRGARADALMGGGMAVMAVPAGFWAPITGLFSLGFAVVFGAAAVRALLPPRTAVHHLHHAVGALAMVYMALFMEAGAAGHGAPGSGVPLVTAALLAYFLLYVLYGGLTLASPAGHGSPAGGWTARPEVASACRVCMGTGMVAMLPAL